MGASINGGGGGGGCCCCLKKWIWGRDGGGLLASLCNIYSSPCKRKDSLII